MVSLVLGVDHFINYNTVVRLVGNFFEPLLIDLWLVEAPKYAFFVFVKESENKTVVIVFLVKIHLISCLALNFQSVSLNKCIVARFVVRHIRVVNYSSLAL